MNLSALDLNLLLVLHVVLEERSVARAAARLHVTSPAVSNALGRLRAALGDPLFVRRGRGLTPTPRARELAPLLARTLGELQHGLGEDFDPRTSTRELAIAMADSDQLASLPQIARAFAARLPRARLRVVSVDTLVSSGGLAGGEVDLVLGPGGGGPGEHHQALFAEIACFVVRRDHPRVRRQLTRAAFASERHVDIHLALGRGGRGHAAAEDVFARQGLVRDIAVVVPTFTAAAMVVARTDLVTGMPRRLAELLGRSLPIKIVAGPDPRLVFSIPIGMTWHERTHRDAAAACLRALVVEALGARKKRERAPLASPTAHPY